MEKIKDFFKNHYLDVFLIAIIFLFSELITYEFGLDELWNYIVSRNVAKNLILYKDISTITTPVSFMIMGQLLKISNTLQFYKVLETLVFGTCFTLIYTTLLKKADRVFSFFVTLIIIIINFCQPYVTYTLFCLIFSIIAFRIVTSEKIKENKYKVFASYLFVIILFTKQNIGFVMCLTAFICLLVSRKFKEYKNFILGMFSIGFIFLIYFCITGSLFEFFDLCFLSIFSFSGSNGVVRTDALVIFFGIMNLVLLVTDLIEIKKEKINPLVIAIILGLETNLYPIFDLEHLVIPTSFLLLVLIYLHKEKIEIKVKSLKIVLIFLILTIISLFTLKYVESLKNVKNTNIKTIGKVTTDFNLDVFKEYIDSFLEGYNIEDIRFCTYNSPLYYIFYDRYDKYYPIMCNGNFGSKDIIETIKEDLDNGKYIVIDEEDFLEGNSWQFPKQILPYLEENATLLKQEDFLRIYGK